LTTYRCKEDRTPSRWAWTFDGSLHVTIQHSTRNWWVFLDVPSAETGNIFFSFVSARQSVPLLFHNLGVFAQDTWRAGPRLTLTFGLRWDIDVAPSTSSSVNIPGVTGFNLNDLSRLALAPPGTAPFKTPVWRFCSASRARLPTLPAFKLGDRTPRRIRRLLRSSYFRGRQALWAVLPTRFSASLFCFSALPHCPATLSFPLDPATAAPPTISPANGISAFDPNLNLPYTLQWNIAVEQGLGKQQSISGFLCRRGR